MLVAAHLVERRGDERFQMHDLLRAYAIERVGQDERESARRAAVTRLLDHYLATAARAADLAFPHERARRPRVETGPATPVPDLDTAADALAWLDRERGDLVAATAHAAGHGWPAHAVALAATLYGYLYVVYRNTDALITQEHALAAARACGDRAAEMAALSNLGITYRVLDRADEAFFHAQQALTLARALGDRCGAANALLAIGKIHWSAGRYPEALDAYQQALSAFRNSGDPAGELAALNNVGDTYLMQGSYAEAAAHYRQVIALSPAVGDRRGEATAYANLGLVLERWGRSDEAFENFQRALRLSREIGQRLREGHTLDDLARIYLRRKDFDNALKHAQQALAIFTEVSYPKGQIAALDDLAQIHLAAGQFTEAAAYARQAIATGRRADRQELVISRNGLGAIELAAGRPKDALAEHEQALALARELGIRHEEARALDGIANALDALGDQSGAVAHWELAMDRYVELGLPEAGQVKVKLDELRSSAICEGPSKG